MSTRPKPYLTPEQYLEIDRAADRVTLSTTSQAVLRARGQRPAYSNQGPSARTLLLSGPRGVLRQASVGGRRKDTLTDAMSLSKCFRPRPNATTARSSSSITGRWRRLKTTSLSPRSSKTRAQGASGRRFVGKAGNTGVGRLNRTAFHSLRFPGCGGLRTR